MSGSRIIGAFRCLADRSGRPEPDMLIALRGLIDEASKEIDVFEATQSEDGAEPLAISRSCLLTARVIVSRIEIVGSLTEPPSSTKIYKKEQSMRQLLAD